MVFSRRQLRGRPSFQHSLLEWLAFPGLVRALRVWTVNAFSDKRNLGYAPSHYYGGPETGARQQKGAGLIEAGVFLPRIWRTSLLNRRFFAQISVQNNTGKYSTGDGCRHYTIEKDKRLEVKEAKGILDLNE